MPARISIVTPSYNQGQFLEETIQSVLSQGYRNLEYIIIDGASHDDSVEIIKKYSERLSYWVSEKDKGHSDALNKGFHRATGEILAFLNSDDVYCPDALPRVARFFQKHPECGAVVGDLEIIDKNGVIVDVKKVVPVTFRRNLYTSCAVPQPSTFFTRRAWEITGNFDTTLRNQLDVDFFLRMLARGVVFGVLPERLAGCRLHAACRTVGEYADLIASNRRIQDAYLRVPFRGAARDYYCQAMKWLCRLELYLLRMATRGVVVPFRSTRARRRALVDPQPRR